MLCLVEVSNNIKSTPFYFITFFLLHILNVLFNSARKTQSLHSEKNFYADSHFACSTENAREIPTFLISAGSNNIIECIYAFD